MAASKSEVDPVVREAEIRNRVEYIIANYYGEDRDKYNALSPEEKRAHTHALAEAVPAMLERESRYRERCVLGSIGIPDRLLDRLVADDLNEDSGAARAVRQAVKDSKILVALSGPPGCGKTTAACIALRRMGGSGLFLSAWTRTRTSVYDEVADAWANVGVLVIDDVGEEYQDAKGFSLSVLDQLITERYDASRVTIITTNLTAARFRDRCGERIADRFREVGAFIELAEDSMRKAP